MSAIVALALAAAVTLTAGIKTYDFTGNEDLVMFDIEESLERAYSELTMEEFDTELEEEVAEIIKIYNREDVLVDTIVLNESEVIANGKTKRLLNQAEFLTSYNNTTIYRIN